MPNNGKNGSRITRRFESTINKKLILMFILSFSLIVKATYIVDQEKLNNLTGDKKLNALIELAKKKTNISPKDNLKIGEELIRIGEQKDDFKIKVLGLQTMAQGFSCSGKYDKSIEFNIKSLNLSKSINYKNGEADAYAAICHLYYYGKKNFSKAIEYYKNAIIAYRDCNNIYGEAKFQNKTANILIRLGEYKTAVKLYLSALQSLEKLKEAPIFDKFISIGNIAGITCMLGNLEVSEKYIKKFEILCNNYQNISPKIELLSLKSKLAFYKEEYEKALTLNNDALLLHKNSHKKISIISDYRTKIYNTEHKIRILLKMGKLDELEKLFKRFDIMFKKVPDYYMLSKILLLRSEYHYKKKQIGLAIKICKKNEKICKNFHYYGLLIKIYSNLSKLYLEINNSWRSLSYLRKKKQIEQKLDIIRIPADIMTIIFNYESNKTSNINKKNIFSIILSAILIIIIFLILFIFSYKHYKKKHFITLEGIKRELEGFKLKSTTKSLSKKKLKFLMDVIIETVKKDKLFLKSDFTLEELSNITGINHYYLSYTINSFWGNNFNDLINTYRVDEAKNILENPKYKDTKIIDIGYKVGFNSISTFNRVFKSKVNISPKQYRTNLLNSEKQKNKY